jgi:hypothetical protein
MALMVAVVSVQVLLRYGFNSSLYWADDIGLAAFRDLGVPGGADRHPPQRPHQASELLVARLPEGAGTSSRASSPCFPPA